MVKYYLILYWIIHQYLIYYVNCREEDLSVKEKIQQHVSLEGNRILEKEEDEEETEFPKNKWVEVQTYDKVMHLKGASIVRFGEVLIIFGGCKLDLTCSSSVYAFYIQ